MQTIFFLMEHFLLIAVSFFQIVLKTHEDVRNDRKYHKNAIVICVLLPSTENSQLFCHSMFYIWISTFA